MAAQDIINAYQAKLGRDPDARELESELENDSKYGHDRFLRELDTRAARTFSGGGTGGDADLDGNGQADAGWMPASPGRGRAWVRPGEDGAMPTRQIPMSLTALAGGTSAPMLGRAQAYGMPMSAPMPAQRRTPHAISSLYALAQQGLI